MRKEHYLFIDDTTCYKYSNRASMYKKQKELSQKGTKSISVEMLDNFYLVQSDLGLIGQVYSFDEASKLVAANF